MRRIFFLAAMLALPVLATAACSSDDDKKAATGGSGGSGATGATGGTGATGATAGTDGGTGTLCAKYGGAANIKSVIETQVIGEIAGDCRINTFFTSLPAEGLTRVSDCLAIQAQELFQCPGVTYTGSMASNGLPCRDMKTIHAGLKISKGDFSALIEDVAAGLKAAGVEDADIAAAAPALLGMESDIVEAPADTTNTQTTCAADAGTD